jgi:hypothetical protein
MPLQFAMDCGSETTELLGLANALRYYHYLFLLIFADVLFRECFHPDVDGNVLPPHNYVRSVHNICVEQSWLHLRLDFGNNAVTVFKQDISDGQYNSANKLQ